MTVNEFFNNLNGGARWDVGVSINRSNKLPLDANSVFPSLVEAESYVAGTHPTRLSNAYPGQLLTVVDAEGKAKVYVVELGENDALVLVHVAAFNDIPTEDYSSYELLDATTTLTEDEKKTVAKRYILTKDGEKKGETSIDIPVIPKVIHPKYEVKALALTEDDVAAGVAQKFALYKDDTQVGDAFTIPEVIHPEYSLAEVTLTDEEKKTIAKRFAITKDGAAVTGASTIDIPLLPEYKITESVSSEDGVATEYTFTKTVGGVETELGVVKIPEIVHPEYKLAEVELEDGDTGIAKKYVLTKDDEAIEDVLIEIPELPVYTIEKAASATGDNLATYYLTKDGAKTGVDINIPKDLIVKDGSVVTFATDKDATDAGATEGAGTYIKLVLNQVGDTDAGEPLYINVGHLIEYVTGGETAEIKVEVSTDHVVTASIKDGSIAQTKLSKELSDALDGLVRDQHTHSNKDDLDKIVSADVDMVQMLVTKNVVEDDIDTLQLFTDGKFVAADVARLKGLTDDDVTRIRAFTDSYKTILNMLESKQIVGDDVDRIRAFTDEYKTILTMLESEKIVKEDIDRIRAFSDDYQDMLKMLVDNEFSKEDVEKTQILTQNNFVKEDIDRIRAFTDEYQAILTMLENKEIVGDDVDRIRAFTNNYQVILAMLENKEFKGTDIDRIRDLTLDLEVLKVYPHDGYTQPDGIPSGIDVGTDNKIISKYSIVSGQGSKAGLKAYIVESVSIGTPDTAGVSPATIKLNTVDGLETNWVYSVRLYGANYNFNRGKITAIDPATNTVTVDVAPTTTQLRGGKEDFFFIIDHPDKGTEDIGIGSTAFGTGCFAAWTSHAEGNATIAYGKYAHAEGTGTEAYYAAHAEGIKSKAYGEYSHAEGNETYVIGNYSHVEGTYASVLGVAAHAEGGSSTKASQWFTDAVRGLYETYKANGESDIHAYSLEGEWTNLNRTFSAALASYSHVEGLNNITAGSASHAEGRENLAHGAYSHVEGLYTGAYGVSSHAEGSHTVAGDDNAHAEGTSTQANAANSHAEGANTQANAANSHAEGEYVRVDINATAAHAEGSHTEALGAYTHAEGNYSKATGIAAHAEGWYGKASGNYGSHAEGNGSEASGESSHAEGIDTDAIGNGSHSEGIRTSATGSGAHAEGNGTSTTAPSAHAEGQSSVASGEAAHAEGWGSKAKGVASHAEGGGSEAANDYDHAEGYYSTTANGLAAHAEGYHTKSWAVATHSEGYYTYASGEAAHAEGNESKASGKAAHAEGYLTNANAMYSHTEGQSTSVLYSGIAAHAEGLGTVAFKTAQHVSGKYNEYDTEINPGLVNAAVIVGGGTSADNRKNIYQLDWDGSAYFAGDVTAPNITLISDDLDVAKSNITNIQNTIKNVANVINYGGIFAETPDLSGVELGKTTVTNKLGKEVILSEGLLIVCDRDTTDLSVDDTVYILNVDGTGTAVWTPFGDPDYRSQEIKTLTSSIESALASIDAIKYDPEIKIETVQCIDHGNISVVSDFETGKTVYLKPSCTGVKVYFKVVGKHADGKSSMYTVKVNGTDATYNEEFKLYNATVHFAEPTKYPFESSVEIVATYNAATSYTDTVKVNVVRDLPVYYGSVVANGDTTITSVDSFKTVSERSVYSFDTAADITAMGNETFCFIAIPADKRLEKIRVEGLSFAMPCLDDVAPVDGVATLNIAEAGNATVNVPAYADYKFYYTTYGLDVGETVSFEFIVKPE